jgi:hypothetical protein
LEQLELIIRTDCTSRRGVLVDALLAPPGAADPEVDAANRPVTSTW